MKLEDIQEYCSFHNKLFCYGAGLYGRIIRSYLSDNDIEISSYVVSENTGNKRTVLGIPIITVDEYSRISDESTGLIVSVSEKYQKEVMDMLRERSITNALRIDDILLQEIEKKCEYKNRYSCSSNIAVFCYHRIADLPMDTWRLAVRPNLFEKQVEYIKDNYVLLRSEEDWGRSEGKPAAVITFDDGYEDMYSNMLPILEKHNVPATVFVCTGNLDTENEFWWDEMERVVCLSERKQYEIQIDGETHVITSGLDREKTCYEIHPYLKKMDHAERQGLLKEWDYESEKSIRRDYCHSMTKKQLLELSKSPLITIGGHTVTHSCLACETKEQQEWEIRKSKRDVEEIIGKEIEVFSYPFGQKDDFTKDTIEIAERAGYKRIFAAHIGLTNSRFVNGFIPRINIGQETDYEKSIHLLRKYETILGDDYV